MHSVILSRNQDLLNAVTKNNWSDYASMCASDLTCFEAESRSHLVQGLPFHKFYYDFASFKGPIPMKKATMASPHVRFVGERCAIISYVRLNQFIGKDDNQAQTSRFEETRVWELQSGKPATEKESWVHVHFHRSNWS